MGNALCGKAATDSVEQPEKAAPEKDEEEPPPPTEICVEEGKDGLHLAMWWAAGVMLPGAQVDPGPPALEAPVTGPFAPKTTTSPDLVGKVVFSTATVDVDGAAPGGAVFTLADNIYARAFFASSLPSYSVGWARLELSKDRPHYNTKKVREKEQMLIEQGREVDYSKRRKYFLYPECIKEIGVFLKVNGTPVSTPAAISSDSWGIDPIEDAFFTFAPERGSIYGTQEGPDSSMPLFLRLGDSDPRYTDARWARLQLELLKELRKQGEGTHTLTLEIAYRYGNWKFVAWNAAEQQSSSRTPAYRYSDEDRDAEEEISVPVAKGKFQVLVGADDVASLTPTIEGLQKVFDAAYKKQTQQA
eukprot:TRINITY_DN4819_c0_g4_i1.p1 TRINITY_DN4819_c0_g4~~TRINITY_DN4819_c0_g4_i1.p1  ORF type:complete len:359 (+),score=131.99 TRINITY_DN4819_c0_g4_i1:68-1144(+)